MTQIKLETPDDFIKKSNEVKKYDDFKELFCATKEFTSIESNQILFATEEIRDIIINLSEYVTTEDSVCVWCKCIENISENESGRILFGVKDAIDCMMKISQYVSTPKSVISWCFCIFRVLDRMYEKGQYFDYIKNHYFGTDEIRNIIMNLAQYSTTSDSVNAWTSVVYTFIVHGDGIDLLKTEEILDAMINSSGYVSDYDAADSWFCALRCIIENPAKRIFFGTDEMREAMKKVYKYNEYKSKSLESFVKEIHKKEKKQIYITSGNVKCPTCKKIMNMIPKKKII